MLIGDKPSGAKILELEDKNEKIRKHWELVKLKGTLFEKDGQARGQSVQGTSSPLGRRGELVGVV